MFFSKKRAGGTGPSGQHGRFVSTQHWGRMAQQPSTTRTLRGALPCADRGRAYSKREPGHRRGSIAGARDNARELVVGSPEAMVGCPPSASGLADPPAKAWPGGLPTGRCRPRPRFRDSHNRRLPTGAPSAPNGRGSPSCGRASARITMVAFNPFPRVFLRLNRSNLLRLPT